MTDKQTAVMLRLINNGWLIVTEEIMEYCTDVNEADNILSVMHREMNRIEKLILNLEES